jgi:hypothetical protein
MVGRIYAIGFKPCDGLECEANPQCDLVPGYDPGEPASVREIIGS